MEPKEKETKADSGEIKVHLGVKIKPSKENVFKFLFKLKWHIHNEIHSWMEKPNISLIGHHSTLKISSMWAAMVDL